MNTTARSTGRVVWVATRAMLVLTLLLGVGYTLVVTGVGKLVLPARADGSLVHDGAGRVVGSALLGQAFTDSLDGDPLPEYFQPRPLAAGDGTTPRRRRARTSAPRTRTSSPRSRSGAPRSRSSRASTRPTSPWTRSRPRAPGSTPTSARPTPPSRSTASRRRAV